MLPGAIATSCNSLITFLVWSLYAHVPAILANRQFADQVQFDDNNILEAVDDGRRRKSLFGWLISLWAVESRSAISEDSNKAALQPSMVKMNNPSSCGNLWIPSSNGWTSTGNKNGLQTCQLICCTDSWNTSEAERTHEKLQKEENIVICYISWKMSKEMTACAWRRGEELILNLMQDFGIGSSPDV